MKDKAQEPRERIKELTDMVKRHNRLYYTEGEPEISDSRYDELLAELKKLENEYPDMARPDSPTRTVGAPVSGKLPKVRHMADMLSLESSAKEEDLYRFDKNCRDKLSENPRYICEPKLDGLSVELVYERGTLSRGATRGDGRFGEDVTESLRQLDSVPDKLDISDPPELLSVRGEVILHVSDFMELNKRRAEQDLDLFANPRNVASGSLRQLDAKTARDRKMRVYCYSVLKIEGGELHTETEAIDFLKEAGFSVAPEIESFKGLEGVMEYHRRMESSREELDYEIDGIVVKVDSLPQQALLGVRTNNPKWAFAYKFAPRREETVVQDIAVQVGRTGVLTPLALLRPVDVGGVTVSRATLHNLDHIRKLDVRIGDHVKIERAGDVIPRVNSVLKRKRTGSEKVFNMPETCPSCGSEVTREEVFTSCPAGLDCPAQVRERIKHFASRNAMDIEGLSDRTVDMLYESGLVKNISDIYSLKKSDLLGLEGWKEKKADNLIKAVESSKDADLARFVFGLGIRNVGRHLASVLAGQFGSLDALRSAGKEELLKIDEIGPTTADNIVAFFKENRNLRQIDLIKQRGLALKAPSRKEGKLAGKKIVFTGSLDNFTRSEARRVVEAAGGEVVSSVSANTDYVVSGDAPGGKLEQARKRSVKIIDEKEFSSLLGYERS